MRQSPLLGRRVHIAGSISEDPAVARLDDVMKAHKFVTLLTEQLVELGANFVVPIDAEHVRDSDGLPICFDWIVLQTISKHISRRPVSARAPMIIATQHHKNEEQIPDSHVDLWGNLRTSELVKILNVSHWNMNSKRMEEQAREGDILIAIGGGEGVLYLANLYHDAGKPVVPINFPIVTSDTGARRLFEIGLSMRSVRHIFKTESSDPHTELNRINVVSRIDIPQYVANVIKLLENLVPPRAFGIRLLDSSNEDFACVSWFFDNVVRPIIEADLGYRLLVLDSQYSHQMPSIDQEIFNGLYSSSLAIADITGQRPNCFLELGYALGRGLPTIITAKQGSYRPFDVSTYSMFMWSHMAADECRRQFRAHWDSVINRSPLVSAHPLVP